MKKMVCVFAVVITTMCLGACSDKATTNSKNNKVTLENTTEEAILKANTEKNNDDEMISVIKTLCKKNSECIGFLRSGTLSFGDNEFEIDYNDENSYMQKVSDERFSSMAQLEEYLGEVYCKEEVNRFLYSYPSENEHLYVEKDGQLYVDLRYALARGYNRKWDDCKISIESCNDNKCIAKITGRSIEPGEDENGVEYSVVVEIIKENNQWVLNGLFE